MEHRVIANVNLEFFFLLFYKFDRPIPIVAFKEPYSGVLNGTRAPWIQVPCKFYFFYFLFFIFFYKFDRPILDFLQIEFQNKSISLISLENETKRWFFWHEKGICPFWPLTWWRLLKTIDLVTCSRLIREWTTREK